MQKIYLSLYLFSILFNLINNLCIFRIGEKSAEISSSQVKTRASVDKVDDKADSRKGKTSSTIAAKVERRHSQLERKNSRSGAEPTTRLERRNSRAGVDSTPIGLERKNSRVGADTPKTDGSTAYRSERRPSRDLIGAYGRQSVILQYHYLSNHYLFIN